MINVVLHQPEIAPNTGNVMRLAANTGAHLHLVEPLGFTLETKALRRAGLDYRDLANVAVHTDFDTCLAAIRTRASASPRLYLVTTHGTQSHVDIPWAPGDIAVFGSESRGLPDTVRQHPSVEAHVRLPMRPGNRSLNLSNAVAVVAFEAWRQLGFDGAG